MMDTSTSRNMDAIRFALMCAVVLSSLPTAIAHGDEDMGQLDVGADQTKPDLNPYPATYFSHPEHCAAIAAHIGLMVVAWVFILPSAVMLSIARSRYTLPAQFVFAGTNAIGILVGVSYNTNTPDLYPNNAHHKLGWVITAVVSAHILFGLVGRVAGKLAYKESHEGNFLEQESFIPVSRENMAEHQRRSSILFSHFPKRDSNDSGQGTERNTESLRSHSMSESSGQSDLELADHQKKDDEDNEDDIPMPTPSTHRLTSFRPRLLRAFSANISIKIGKALQFWYNFVDRTILIIGYITLCTGVITFGRFFEGHEIFSGLAHWIKGGIFFWYGILTLGRWSGTFGELGWAWNVRPKQKTKKWRPTAEFVEGFLIFFYGSTNVFLEHLGNWGKEYSPQDLEHISITVLFIGGGLLAMLIESTRIRELLNTTVQEATIAPPQHGNDEEERAALEPPETYEFSINPIPALVIFLLGIMMSSHTQHSMISSMVHKQWGNLLTAAAFARGFTYVLLYLKPPRSVLPSRPPTELLTAFGLIAGGIVFKASANDTIAGMEHYNLDAMFIYTVTMGFVGVFMSWVIILVALKGWAVRKEGKRPQRYQAAMMA